MGKPDKKPVFSPHCGDKTTTYYRAFLKGLSNEAAGDCGAYIADRDSVAGGWHGDGAVSRSNRECDPCGRVPCYFLSLSLTRTGSSERSSACSSWGISVGRPAYGRCFFSWKSWRRWMMRSSRRPLSHIWAALTMFWKDGVGGQQHGRDGVEILKGQPHGRMMFFCASACLAMRRWKREPMDLPRMKLAVQTAIPARARRISSR